MLSKKSLMLALPTLLLSAFFIWSFFSYPIFATEKIDINTASIDQIDQLEGVGSVYAQRIIDGRPYSSLDDLLRVKGIGPTILQKIKDQGLACVNCGAAQENSNSEALEPSDSPAPTSTTTATPTPTPGYQYSQKIFINEFLPWPESGAKEWVEIVNLDNAAINLAGWQIDDGNASTSPQAIPADITIAPRDFLVISFNKNVLNNDTDKVRLLWPDDQVVHVVFFDKAKQNQAVAKFDAGWLWTNRPTPGQANKKSFTEAVEAVSTPDTPTNNVKIITIEEAAAVPAGAPRPAAPIKNTSQSVTISNDSIAQNDSPSRREAPSNNISLLAAASEPTGSVKNNSYLALAGVLFLSALSASGLIYFRRQKQVDIDSLDD